LSGVDADFFRRDLYEAIERGDYPEYKLLVQIFDEEFAEKFTDKYGFNVLDSTKIIPEEEVPLTHIGTLILNRNPDNFFAETEQVAFCPGNIVPGIDFTDDPLLQGRLFSYIDTQLLRLGGPNFNNIPINRPGCPLSAIYGLGTKLQCPLRNFQRDGLSRYIINKGRVAYEPNSLCPLGPRENPKEGFRTYPTRVKGHKIRARSETFADHYSQARQFWKSMTIPEQEHIANAFAFELGKLDSPHVRLRMLGQLYIISCELYEIVSGILGMTGKREDITPAVEPIDLPPSPVLSMIRTFKPTLSGRNGGLIVTDGVNQARLNDVIASINEENSRVTIIAQRIGNVRTSTGRRLKVNVTLSAGSSVQYDACMILPAEESAQDLNQDFMIEWLRNAFLDLKAIGYSTAAIPFFKLARVNINALGIIRIVDRLDLEKFIEVARHDRVWRRDIAQRPDLYDNHHYDGDVVYFKRYNDCDDHSSHDVHSSHDDHSYRDVHSSRDDHSYGDDHSSHDNHSSRDDNSSNDDHSSHDDRSSHDDHSSHDNH
jgi:catalase